MFDSIKSFFQDMYNDFTGYFDGLWNDLVDFFNLSGDILLILVVLALTFVVFKVLRYLTVPAIIIGQILMLTGLISGLMVFVGLLATALVSIYNRIYALSDYIGSSIPATSCATYMFDCLSITGVLSTYFTELFALFVTVLLIKVSFIFFWAMNMISDKIWRIGVLLGLV